MINDMENNEDYKQIAFKLQDDIDTKCWEEAHKNIPFLKEMAEKLKRYEELKDITHLQMVYKMIDDWIEELEETLNK